MIVDIRKLDALREMIDDAVCERSLSDECSRRVALFGLAYEIGYQIHSFQNDTGFWFTSAMTPRELERLDRVYKRWDSDMASEFETKCRLPRTCVALATEDAELAMVVRLLDSSADVGFENQKFEEDELGNAIAMDWCGFHNGSSFFNLLYEE